MSAGFKTAVGSDRGQYKLWNGTVQTSAKAAPGYKTLKYRTTGQNSAAELKARDFASELKRKESGGGGAVSVAAAAAAAAAAALQLGGGSAVRANELDKDDESEEQPHHHRQDSAQAARRDDADDDDDAEPSSSSSSSDDDDDDSQDETAELMRELARIKAEREAERLRLEHEKLERDARDNEAAVLRSNPLMNNDRPGAAASASSDSVLKRKWFDETVFKNQAKVDDPKKPKRFINDTIRSDFHIRFLDRYIK